MEIQRATANEAARTRARVLLLNALESYAAALEEGGAPLPHRLRVELNLYRVLDQVR